MSNKTQEEIMIKEEQPNQTLQFMENKTKKSNYNQSTLFTHINSINCSKERLPEVIFNSTIEPNIQPLLKSSSQLIIKPDTCIDINNINISSIEEETKIQLNENNSNGNNEHEIKDKKNDKSIKVSFCKGSSFRLINDKDESETEIKRLKNLINPYDSVNLQSEHSSIVKEKNNALISNYQINSIKSIRDYETPFSSNQEDNIGLKKQIQRIEILQDQVQLSPMKMDSNKSIKSNGHLNKLPITSTVSCLNDNTTNKEERKTMKRIKLYRNDSKVETPGGRNIFSKPDDIPIDKASGQFKYNNLSSSNKKMNSLDLPNNVPIFKSQIIIEQKDIIDRKKMYIINDNKYSVEPLKEETTFPFQFTLMDDSINKKIKFFYEEHLLQIEIESTTRILLNSTQLDLINSYVIGPALPIKRLVSIISSNKTGAYCCSVKQLENNIELTRSVFSDGDGFFRAIAFSIVEYWIITQSVNKIQLMIYKIINDFGKTFDSNDFKMDQKPIIIILTLIINHMTKDSLPIAYELFVKSFLTNPIFETEMIKYIKLSLAEYLYSNQTLFNLATIQKHISVEYFDNQKLMINQYINDKILVKKEEPNNLIMIIFPKVFGINVIFYYIEPVNLVRYQFIGNEETIHDKSFIIIIKSLGRYEIGYRYSIMFKNVNNYYVNNSYVFKPRFIEKEIVTTCQVCKLKDKEISPVSYPEVSICKNCIWKGIYLAINKLNSVIEEGNYKHFECI